LASNQRRSLDPWQENRMPGKVIHPGLFRVVGRVVRDKKSEQERIPSNLLTPIMALSSCIVTCLALSTAAATCC